jgi:hypothetical protein
MTLRELAGLSCAPRAGAAPDWMMGCFRRQSIIFYTAAIDTATEVYWLQCRGLSADVRIPAGGPEPRGRALYSDYSREELKALAEVEGGMAETTWDGQIMRWSPSCAFQIHQKWPEPGQLRRIGDCMIEFAPSGAYVEDWRIQPSRPGPVVGLRLVREYNVDTGAVTHCGGGLIVCGDHAALVLGRPRSLPPCSRLSELVAGSAGSLLNDVFAFEASFAMLDEEARNFTITRSTNPGRCGESLAITDGYIYNPDTRLISQRFTERGASLERLFLPDTLKSSFEFSSATSVCAESAEWLERESNTLLACTGQPRRVTAPLI